MLNAMPEPDHRRAGLPPSAAQHLVRLRARATPCWVRVRGFLRRRHPIRATRTHLPAPNYRRIYPASARYMIWINEHLGATLLAAFPAMAWQRHGPETVLTGMLDRSAFHSVLAEIEGLGLELLEIRQLAPEARSPGR